MATFYLPPRFDDPFVQHARHVIHNKYGDRVKVGPTDLLKFGRTNNADSAALTTVMTLPGAERHETLVSDNLITVVSSTSASDTQSLSIEGHTISGTDFTTVTQTVTLSGTSQVSLTTPLARISIMENASSSDLTGTVYAYETDSSTAGVPDTDSKVHCMINAGYNQSDKCSTTLSSKEHWLISAIDASMGRATGASVAADIAIEVKEAGGVFKIIDEFTISSGVAFGHTYQPFLIVPANADVRLTAITTANDTSLTGSIHGMLAVKY
jgi:hypothetical protein